MTDADVKELRDLAVASAINATNTASLTKTVEALCEEMRSVRSALTERKGVEKATIWFVGVAAAIGGTVGGVMLKIGAASFGIPLR